ncbi:MAG: hypothetical protein ACI835_004590, partial [Planctomycetota bacterium]
RQRVSKGGRYDLVPRGPATCAMVALDWLNVSNSSTRKPGSSVTVGRRSEFAVRIDAVHEATVLRERGLFDLTLTKSNEPRHRARTECRAIRVNAHA